MVSNNDTKNLKIVVCGGAGYIGSHVVRYLLSFNHTVIVIDNLSTGHIQSLDLSKVIFIQSDIKNTDQIEFVFREHKPDAVMHFCAYSLVGESVRDPLKYYDNNVCGAISLLTAMKRQNIKYIIFSSTAAIFGNPENDAPILEDDHKKPTNPYGETKLVTENMLHWCDQSYGIKSVCLRYFNACGACEMGDIGESHEPETHLVPNIIKTALGKNECLNIFGNDYPTRDGTCVRDYVHVDDLASAHLYALNYLLEFGRSNVFNLGSGTGFSVSEILECSNVVTGTKVPFKICARRAGDPPSLIASSQKAQDILGWKVKYTELSKIIETAWNWHKRNLF